MIRSASGSLLRRGPVSFRLLGLHCSAAANRFFASQAPRYSSTMASSETLPSRMKKVFTESTGPSFGLWQMFAGANISRILAATPGIDWVMVDCEHGNIDGMNSPSHPGSVPC